MLGSFDEAESLLVRSHETLSGESIETSDRVASYRSLIRLYDDWGKPEMAARYKAELAGRDG